VTQRRGIAAPKRPSFWLALSLAGNVLVWTLLLNHKTKFPLDGPQFLFGFQIPSRISFCLMLCELGRKRAWRTYARPLPRVRHATSSAVLKVYADHRRKLAGAAIFNIPIVRFGD